MKGNKIMLEYGKEQIKIGLSQLSDKQHLLFKRMYSYNNLDKPIDEIVDELPDERVSLALTQVHNSLKIKSDKREVTDET